MEKRPNFIDIKTYKEFSKYYWYRDELRQICKNIGIDCTGIKNELNYNIEQYFKGIIVNKTSVIKNKKTKNYTDTLTPNTKLLECDFCFNQKYREFFSEQTGVKNFKFNADMAATAKKVKLDNDVFFTLQDMLDIYYGKKEYARYDNSSCQWNKFLKDFCADKNNNIYSDKLKAASILWGKVRNSTKEKVYTENLVKEFDANC